MTHRTDLICHYPAGSRTLTVISDRPIDGYDIACLAEDWADRGLARIECHGKPVWVADESRPDVPRCASGW